MSKKFDFSKLNSEIRPIEEGLKKVVPLDLPEEVISGDKQINVTSAERTEKKGCVKLEISF